MANDFSGNFREKILNIFADSFESSRVLLNTVNTSLFRGQFNPSSGSSVAMKRPHQYAVINTPKGDISAQTKSAIISGDITCNVQEVATVALEWDSFDESLTMNQLEELLRPAAEELVIDTETKLYDFATKSLGLTYGTPGTAVAAWSDVAGTDAMGRSVGVPMTGERFYVMNPFENLALSDAQNGLTAADDLVRTAWENARISKNFGGMRALMSNAQSTFDTMDGVDRIGALAADPDETYLTAKDSMTQAWSVTGFEANATIKAGDTVEVTGRFQVNIRNRKIIKGVGGANVKFRAVVTADVLLGASGEGVITVTGPGIFETLGQYNTVNSKLTSGDVVTVITPDNTELQPSLYYHKNALSVTSVPQKKLFATDGLMTTKDGLQIRITKFADGETNENKIRFDLIPAFAVINPFWGGQAYGL